MKYSFFLILIAFVLKLDCNEIGHTFDLSKLKKSDKMVGMLVIGGGPAGLTAAMNGGNFGIPTLVLTGYDIGGQINQTSIIDNMPGVRKSPASEIVKTLEYQVKDFGAMISDQRAVSVEVEKGPPFKVKTDTGEVIWTWCLMVATGSEVRKSGVKGEDQYFGQGISPCAKCDAHFFMNKNVVVIGGGDTAMEEAMHLSSYAKNVTILVRSGELKAAHRMQDRLKGYSKIRIDYNKSLVEVLGDDAGVTGVKVKDNVTNKISFMKTDGIFLAIGRIPRNDLVKDKLKLDRFGYIHTDESCQSVSHAGVFAVGEVGNPACSQAVEAASSGSIAANAASHYLRSIGLTEDFYSALKERLLKAH